MVSNLKITVIRIIIRNIKRKNELLNQLKDVLHNMNLFQKSFGKNIPKIYSY